MTANVRAIPTLSFGRPIVDESGAPQAWFLQAWNDLLLRTGGQTTNAIADATATAATATASASAVTAGVATGFTLDPVNPLSYTEQSIIAAQIAVAAHTRTESGVATAFPAGVVTDAVNRNATYYVYYLTPGTYLASASAADVAADPGNKLIGTVFVAAPDLSFLNNFNPFGR